MVVTIGTRDGSSKRQLTVCLSRYFSVRVYRSKFWRVVPCLITINWVVSRHSLKESLENVCTQRTRSKITVFLFPHTCKTDVMRVWSICGRKHNQGISGHYLIAKVTLLPTSQAKMIVTGINPVRRPSLRDSTLFDGCKRRNEFPRLITVDWITGTVYIQLFFF